MARQRNYAPYFESLGTVTYSYAGYDCVLGLVFERRHFVNAAGERLFFTKKADAQRALDVAKSRHPARTDTCGIARVYTT